MKYYFVFLVFLLSSCFTEQKANKQLKRIEENYPLIVSEKCSELYPPTIIKDSLKFTEFISRIDTFLSINTDTILVIDTILKSDYTLFKKYNNLVVKLNSAESFVKQLKEDLRKNPPYIIKNIIDSSKVFTLTKQRDLALHDKEMYRNRYDVFLSIAFCLLIIIIVLISYIYINESKSKLY